MSYIFSLFPLLAATDTPPAVSVLCQTPAVTDLRVTCDRWPDATDLRRFALDAIRIEGAKTEEDKCLAVWRWMRRCTIKTDGRAPSEATRGMLDSMKILNVYGAEQCGGLSLLVTDLWRALGYRADRLYRHGQRWPTAGTWTPTASADTTSRQQLRLVRLLARRWAHRDGGGDRRRLLPLRLAEPHPRPVDRQEDVDVGLVPHGAVRPARSAVMALHPGESAERLWGNIGKAVYQHMDVREWDQKDQPPYERTLRHPSLARSSRISAADPRVGPSGRDANNGPTRGSAPTEQTWRDQLAVER